MQLPIIVEDLKDKVAVVTGAGGVICSELSRLSPLRAQRLLFLTEPLRRLRLLRKKSERKAALQGVTLPTCLI